MREKKQDESQAKRNSELMRYLEAIARLQSNHKVGKEYYKWLLENGEWFEGNDNNREFNQSFRKRANGCYYNAQMLAIENQKLDYYEGWGIPGGVGIPLSHGFNVLNGEVIDISWPDGVEYFGVRIPVDFICREQLRTSSAGYILFQYWLKEIHEKRGKK